MTARIELVSKLDTDASDALAQALIEKRGADLVLDASGVEHMGAHAVQILVIASHSWKQDGNALTLENLPDDQVEQLTSIGLPPSKFMTVENAV
jgi:chemotaxis protein CheX